ncbi:MAG: hypothetical protein IKH54_01875 [Bacilli bacterium]|nr:hypothetical protein [Bacilli bacterium]
MKYRIKERKLFKLNNYVLLLSLICLILYSILVFNSYNIMKYLSLVVVVYSTYVLNKEISYVINYIKAKKVKKYNFSKINSKYIYDGRRKLKELVDVRY